MMYTALIVWVIFSVGGTSFNDADPNPKGLVKYIYVSRLLSV